MSLPQMSFGQTLRQDLQETKLCAEISMLMEIKMEVSLLEEVNACTSGQERVKTNKLPQY